jgi:NADH-quinone oxidoreductase subunit L
MGGLRKKMPVTHASFLVACLAIAGLPPFAGFFSKEAILLTAYESNMLVYVLALATSALTAFYMFRLYFTVFWQKEAAADHHHPEGTVSMKIPLIVLSVLSLAAGFVPFSSLVTVDGVPVSGHFSPLFAALPVGLSLTGILLAANLYKKRSEKPAKAAAFFGRLYGAAIRKFYIDELWLFFTRKILFNLVGKPAAWFDRNIIDGAMNGLAYVTTSTANLVKTWQSGRVQQYTLWFFSGVAGLAVLFIYLWK